MQLANPYEMLRFLRPQDASLYNRMMSTLFIQFNWKKGRRNIALCLKQELIISINNGVAFSAYSGIAIKSTYALSAFISHKYMKSLSLNK